MMPWWLAVLLGAPVLIMALLPMIVTWVNLRFYPRTTKVTEPEEITDLISIMVPARNEEDRLSPLIESVLAQQHQHWELLILDDHSTDGTAALIQSYAAKDERVRLVTGPPLPEAWAGKQHANHLLSQEAQYDLMLFLDADLRLETDALSRLILAMKERPKTQLLSGVPRQIVVSPLEHALIPLIHVVLLGYLPMWWMRSKNDESFGAGCGQLFLARRQAYHSTKGHGHPKVQASFHDGLHLPRVFREHDYHTDLIDPTDLVQVRMYDDDLSLWQGLRKNATAGLGAPKAIIPWTIVLSLGHWLAWPLLLIGLITLNIPLISITGTAIACNLLMRVTMALRFKQSPLSILLHSPGIMLLLTIQWQALRRSRQGKKESWRGRQAVGLSS